MNVSIPIAVCVIALLTPQFMCWNICKKEFFKAFKKPLPLIVIMLSNWFISPLTGILSASIFLTANLSFKLGVSLLFLGPSISMVIYWNKLAGGSQNLVMTATLLNLILIIAVYPLAAYILIGLIAVWVPLEIVFLTIIVFFLTPLLIGLLLRMRFRINVVSGDTQLPVNRVPDKISVTAFFTLILVLYVIQSENILLHMLDFIILSIPIIFGYMLVYVIVSVLCFITRLSQAESATAIIVGSGNQYELAIAASAIIFGVQSSVAFAVSIGPLLEAPLMLLVIAIIYRLSGLRSSKKL